MTQAAAPEQLWRVVPYQRRRAAEQLALGEVLHRAVGTAEVPPTLRLYSFDPPALILGIAQPVADANQDRCRELTVDLVRRSSGGTAVYHDSSAFSFDFIVPSDHPLAAGDVHRSYARLAVILDAAFSQLGVAASPLAVAEARAFETEDDLASICFAARSPAELVVRSRKLVGLAQIRRAGAVTLHGVVYRSFDAGRTAELLDWPGAGMNRAARVRRLAEQVIDLEQTVGRPVSAQELADAFVTALTSTQSARVEHRPVCEAEWAQARALAAEKYATWEWTARR